MRRLDSARERGADTRRNHESPAPASPRLPRRGLVEASRRRSAPSPHPRTSPRLHRRGFIAVWLWPWRERRCEWCPRLRGRGSNAERRKSRRTRFSSPLSPATRPGLHCGMVPELKIDVGGLDEFFSEPQRDGCTGPSMDPVSKPTSSTTPPCTPSKDPRLTTSSRPWKPCRNHPGARALRPAQAIRQAEKDVWIRPLQRDWQRTLNR